MSINILENESYLDNYILAIYKIDEEDINKKIQIINCNKDNSNKEIIENSCEIFLNNEKINFSYFYIFNEEGEYTFKFDFNTKLTNISFLFYNCINLISIDFSHFMRSNISTMRSLFRKCIHLIKVDVESSFEPIIGSEMQSKELINHLMEEKDDKDKIWKSEIFGRTLENIVQENIQSKLSMLPESSKAKLEQTITKMVNKGSNNLIAIVL
jgi:hypothetical protein